MRLYENADHEVWRCNMSEPLSYRAALQGTFGKREQYSLSSITDALFVYLDGKPEPESIVRVDSHFRGRPRIMKPSPSRSPVLRRR